MGLVISSNGSGYTTATKVRNYASLPSATDISDTDLATFITYASRTLARDISVRVWNERLVGVIDGSNVVFLTANPYIADRNLDLVVDTSDVVCYTCKRDATTNAITRSTATVSSVGSTGGVITLATAPTTSNTDWVELDYEHYVMPVYSDMLEQAVNALVAHLVHVRNKDPSKVTLAQLRGRGGDAGSLKGDYVYTQASRWLFEYQELVRRIKSGELRGADAVNPNRA